MKKLILLGIGMIAAPLSGIKAHFTARKLDRTAKHVHSSTEGASTLKVISVHDLKLATQEVSDPKGGSTIRGGGKV